MPTTFLRAVFKFFFNPVCVSVAAACLFFGAGSLRGAPAKITYRGFTIDESRLQTSPDLEAIHQAIQQQIDIVLEVGLPKEIEAFLQEVPFVLIPAEDIPRGTPGLYERGSKTVKVTSRIVSTGNKPVLLHELLHAYHHQRVPQGFQNAEIIRFYDKAKIAGNFSEKSHMMQNPNEYFACAGTTYLFGETAQEPFSRDKLKTAAPDYFAFLVRLFGDQAGKFDGKLDGAATKPKRRK
ncbi:MAG: hypothetical protein QM715_19255 [Nibricoccus sp.]